MLGLIGIVCYCLMIILLDFMWRKMSNTIVKAVDFGWQETANMIVL